MNDDTAQSLAHQQQEQQEQEMNIYAKLNVARCKLQEMKLKKSGHNKFAGYDYFELGDFLPAALIIFRNEGLCGMVSFTPELATLRVVDTDSDSEIVFTSPMGSANLKGCHEIQNIGAVETYQRRYLWVAAMEISEHDALDSSEPVDTRKAEPTLNVPELVKAIGGASSFDILKDIFGKAYPVASAAQKRVLKAAYDRAKIAFEPATETETNPFEGVAA